MFVGQYSTKYGLIMAASVVSLIPVAIVFLIFQKQFVQGIATSGVRLIETGRQYSVFRYNVVTLWRTHSSELIGG